MFVAVYWWRVKPGKEEQFRQAWRRGTELITERYRSFGSRLHRERDGRFVGYAQWPDYESWQRAFDAKMFYDDAETRAKFVDAIAETAPNGKPVFLMEISDDLLTDAPGGAGR
jgi:heme-degrading monooxygenase HmoA